MRGAAVIVLLVAGGCVPEQGPTMRPGDNCLRCHGGVPAGSQEGGHNARPWTFAGTVYSAVDAPADAGIEGAAIDVTDSSGRSFSVHSNLVGNFYSAESLVFPLKVCVEYGGLARCMTSLSPHGACNYCHATPPLDDAPGRIVAGGTAALP